MAYTLALSEAVSRALVAPYQVVCLDAGKTLVATGGASGRQQVTA
ncbi:hypothetical protein AADR41_11035 [Streptomyces sp. CLV115]